MKFVGKMTFRISEKYEMLKSWIRNNYDGAVILIGRRQLNKIIFGLLKTEFFCKPRPTSGKTIITVLRAAV